MILEASHAGLSSAVGRQLFDRESPRGACVFRDP
jgi:hypothetical protein